MEKHRDLQTKAEQLIADGYFSTSNKYKSLARLPEGKSGLDALQASAPDMYADIMRLAEHNARSTYLRMVAVGVEVGSATFQAFKRAGGPSA